MAMDAVSVHLSFVPDAWLDCTVPPMCAGTPHPGRLEAVQRNITSLDIEADLAGPSCVDRSSDRTRPKRRDWPQQPLPLHICSRSTHHTARIRWRRQRPPNRQYPQHRQFRRDQPVPPFPGFIRGKGRFGISIAGWADYTAE